MVGNYRNLSAFVYTLEGACALKGYTERSALKGVYLKLVKPQGFRIISGN